jgi:hypothetical protein
VTVEECADLCHGFVVAAGPMALTGAARDAAIPTFR